MGELLALPHEEPAPADGSGAMFDRIAGRYDRLNSILSLGRDRSWRRRAARALEPARNARILDVGAGTADLALAILELEPTARVHAVDPAPRMLALGREKARRRGVAERIEMQEGDVQSLAFADASFDGAGIAFGIRNVPDRLRALREMARVVRPGGRVVVLELTEPRGSLLAPLARSWVRYVVPRLGGWLAGRHEYRYLEESIGTFPSPARFAETMREASLEEVTATALTCGACHLFVGRRGAGRGGRVRS